MEHYELFVLARAIHVLCVVIWIGGVAMVTMAVLPSVAGHESSAAGLAFFEGVERRFKWIARVTTVLVGATGFYMLYAMKGWWMFTRASYWWVHAMVLVWLIFTVLLFVVEPLVIEPSISGDGAADPDATIRRMQRVHTVLLIISLVTVFGAVAGAHGWLLFD